MTGQAAPDDVLRTYVVLAVHPRTGAAYDLELVATSATRAVSRARGTMVHRDRDAYWLDGSFTVTGSAPFVSRRQDGGDRS